MKALRKCRKLLGLPIVLHTFLCVVILTCVAGGVGCGDTGVSVPAEPVPVEKVLSANKDSLYDIDATSTDVKLVLEALAKRSGANIVVSPEITGEISAHLKQMSIDSILDYLSTVQGFGWKKSDGTYLVAAKDRLVEPQVAAVKPIEPAADIFVWDCWNIRSAELVRTITSLFPKIKIIQGPGHLTPSLNNATTGITGSTLTVTSRGSKDGADSGSEAGNSNSSKVVLMGEARDIAQARYVITQLDVKRQQVSIKVEILEVTSSLNKELGIDWTWNDLVLKEPENQAASGSGIKFGSFKKQPMSVTGTISAMLKNGSARLLAQPNISVVDGENADILIGDRILFPKLVGYTQFGTPMYDKQEERVGIYLQIAPKITNGNDILMTLYPQVSLVTGYLKTQAGDYPQISTREAITTISVRSGATWAIGGLVKEDELKNISKVPLLGDLPIIGNFFRSVKKSKERREIVILLTPQILEDKQGS